MSKQMGLSMNIQSIKIALSKGNRKLVGRLIYNSQKLVEFVHCDDYLSFIDLLEKGPVDLDYVDAEGFDVIKAATYYPSRNGDKIEQLVLKIKRGEITQISDFVYEPKNAIKPRTKKRESKTLKKYKSYHKQAVEIEVDPRATEEIVDVFESNFGRTVCGLPNDEWPTLEGKPLFFLCQFNLKEPKYVPPVLKDYALITLFANERCSELVIRGYNNLEELTCLNSEKDKPCLTKSASIVWLEPYEDYPHWDDLVLENQDIPEEFFESEEYEGLITSCSKMGGYPSSIQSYPFDPLPEDVEFCFQINAEPQIKLYLVDRGTLYIGKRKSTLDWCYDLQFY